MEDERHESEHLRDGPGGDGLDLPELCLSPLQSPAMTTVASGSEGLSVVSDGELGLAMDDNEGEDEEEDARNDHGDIRKRESGGDDGMPSEGKQGQDNTAASICLVQKEDEVDQGDKEEQAENLTTSAQYYTSELPRQAQDLSPRDASQEEVHQDEDNGNEMEELPSTLPAELPPLPQALSFPTADASDDSDDDDMTVECASPRDPAELDDAKLPTNEARPSRSSEVLIHPMPPAQAPSLPAAPQSAYSLKTLFPVVYEEPAPSRVQLAITTEKARPSRPSRQTKSEEALKPKETEKTKNATEAVAAGEKDRMPSKSASESTEKAHKALLLQLQVSETDRKQLAQRNARLKSQLSLLTADLVRTKADAAKYKTENELYAAKMPKLQAELSDETTQVDENHAQTIQSQLEITQLRAKLQVLQTRAGNLDSQVEKLQNELRAVKKDARRRAIVQQQMDEKMKRLETELHEAKANHAQDTMLSKQKLTSTIQRLEHERVKREADMKKNHQQQLEEARALLAKATKKVRRLQETTVARDQELAVLKKRVEECEEETRTHGRRVKSLETQLDRAERAEASVRGQVITLKAQLKVVDREKAKLLRTSSVPSRMQRRRPSSQPQPSPPRRSASTPSSDDATAPPLCSCCRMVMDSMAKADRLEELTVTDDHEPTADHRHQNCKRCETLEAQLTAAHDDLTQLRTLHATELKVQATAFERVVAAFRRAASP